MQTTPRSGRSWLLFAAASSFVVAPVDALAAVVHVGPGDSYAKIEAAAPGDEVVVAPGTYGFRVYLTQKAPASSPIVIHAEDPSNPPVWDMASTLVESAPGSYGAGDKGRGCWQISGGTNYVIEGIVFTHCRTSTFNSAGIRYYNGAAGIVVRDCVFRDNDDGITGGTQDSEATVEYCEFDHNGNTSASSGSPTHNLYIYGGTFTLRYSWVHDAAQAQNFHVRAKQATIEYNFFARAASYQGDLMTDDDYAGGSTFEQSMVLRGNVFLQGTTQSNTGQIFVLYNDTQASGLTLRAHVLYNTLVGAGAHAAFVHLSNADGSVMEAQIDDNIVYGTSVPVLVEDTAHGTATGTHNWLATGANGGPLTASVFGAAPGFANAAGDDFHLATGSGCIGAASATGLSDVPDEEYWRDETVTRMSRARSSVNDVGAFESTTTASPVGPYGSSDAGPAMDGSAPPGTGPASLDSGLAEVDSTAGTSMGADAAGGFAGMADASCLCELGNAASDGGSGEGPARDASPGNGGGAGCSCRASEGAAGAGAWLTLVAVGVPFVRLVRRWRRRPSP